MKSKLILLLALVLIGCFTATRSYGDVQSAKVADVAKVKLKFVKVDSEETNSQNGYGDNAVDGNPNTYWHTQWQSNSPGLPHVIIIELRPPSVIKGFTYLPRQDESYNGTIKDYEFYVSDDGTNFGEPVKKGKFESGKGEKIEAFEPVRCGFIKLKAISEINGWPWTSAAEIRVIQSGEDASVKDYWRGNIGQTNDVAGERHDAAKPDAIDVFIAACLANGFWLNGMDAALVTKAVTPEEVISETLHMARFEGGLITSYRIVNIRKVHVDPFVQGTYTAALVDTNLGRMIVLMQYIEGKGSTPGHWWRRIYDANSTIKRLY